MVHQLVFYKDNTVMDIINTQWLRDMSPRCISWDTPYFIKEKLETHEIKEYTEHMRNYIDNMELCYPEFPFEQLRQIELTDESIQNNFNTIIESIIVKVEKKQGQSEALCNELNDLFDILIDEDGKHPGFGDEIMVKFWEFQEALEAGLYMVSSDATQDMDGLSEKRIYKDIYDIIVNFINLLDIAASRGWTAKWTR